MSDATTPANPTDQIATVAATPVVAQDAQRYGHDEAMADIFDLAHIETEFEGHDPRVTSLAAYIERLEAERDDLERWWHECQQIAESAETRALEAEAERDALRLRVDELSRMVGAGLQVSAAKR